MPSPLHLYRPQRTRPELLEATFVAREPLAGEILERLESWRPGASRQHYLLIGPRGIGKTNLLKIVEYRMRRTPALSEKWVPVVLAEDFYGIGRLGDLLLEMLRTLVEDDGQRALEGTYQSVRYDDDDFRVVDRCLDAFRLFHRESGRGIVLMLENLDRLLERQMKKRSEARRWRKILIEEDWLVVLCTSPTYLNAVTRPEEPFFEFFQVLLLPELTQREQAEMFWKLAAADGNTELAKDRRRLEVRLRALYHFTGGNPRLTAMLYDLVAHHHIDAVRNELELLLDQLTPFYQDRMKDVSDQEAKVLEAMALLAEGCTPTELAREARMAAKTVRGVLTRLERAGYVQREERRHRRTIYIIRERFFRIWHQMNHSRAVKGRIRYLLEFFTSWYATREERDRLWRRLLEDFESGGDAGDEQRAAELAEYMEHINGLLASSPLESVREAIRAVTPRLGDSDELLAPYSIALDYLESGKDVAVLERQQPEMREAAELILDLYESRREDADSPGGPVD